MANEGGIVTATTSGIIADALAEIPKGKFTSGNFKVEITALGDVKIYLGSELVYPNGSGDYLNQ